MKTLFTNCFVYLTELKKFKRTNFIVENGKFVEVDTSNNFASQIVNLNGKFVIPGLVDVHTHGRVGYDFDDIPEDKIEQVRNSYADNGTTTIMATLASTPYDNYFKQIEKLKNSSKNDTGCNIAGIHIEGRYLAESKRGAHATELLAKPSVKELDELLDAIMPLPAHVSEAAELEGSEEFIKEARMRGATISIAHSDATYEESMKAIEWGAVGFTHTFNAMRGLHHREPGTVGASLLADNAYSEFICDGFHINPVMIKLAARVKNLDKFVLITDSLSASGMPDGEYACAGIPVFVKNGQAINAEGAIAGSTIALIDGLRNLVKFTGMTVEEAIPCATINPCKMVNIDKDFGSISKGKSADFLIIDSKENLEIENVYIKGKLFR